MCQKIFYWPQIGGKNEALRGQKQFKSVDKLFKYLIEQYSVNGVKPFDIDDLFIKKYGKERDICFDTFVIMTGRFFEQNYLEMYHCPQAIGFFKLQN